MPDAKHKWRWATDKERRGFSVSPWQVMNVCRGCGLVHIRPRGRMNAHLDQHFWIKGELRWRNTGLRPIPCEQPLDYQI